MRSAPPITRRPTRLSRALPTLVLSILAILAPLLLPACGGSGAGGTQLDPPSTTTLASLVVTDAVSDELEHFEVDLTRVVLERPGATDVTLLDQSARIDFTALSDVGDWLAAAEIPRGVYSGIRLRFDFSTASVYLKDKSAAASLVDAQQQALTGVLEVPVRFPTSGRPTAESGKNHTFLLDLNLEQALTVDTAQNRVTFAPVVQASFDPSSPKPTSVHGVLTSVDIAKTSFVLERRTTTGAAISSITVQTNANTVFEVHGVATNGLNSFPKMTALSLGTARVRVRGSLDSASRTLVATSIAAGRGTIGNEQDFVRGLITARSGGSGSDATLTVYGHAKPNSGSPSFNTSFTVQTQRLQTKVVRTGDTSARSTDALNVGQHVEVFGDLSGTTLDARATDGVVRMLPTTLFGTANSSASGNTIALTLTRIGTRPIGDFDFSVASTPEADPNAYTVSAGVLTLFGVSQGSKIEATGFMNPVGVANDRNFESSKTVNRSSSNLVLDVQWQPAQSAGITTNSSALTLDVSNASVAQVRDGFGGTTLNASPAPAITGLPAGLFTLVVDASAEVHQDYTAFVAAVATQLGNGAKAQRISGLGTFVPTTQIYLANIVSVVLTSGSGN